MPDTQITPENRGYIVIEEGDDYLIVEPLPGCRFDISDDEIDWHATAIADDV